MSLESKLKSLVSIGKVNYDAEVDLSGLSEHEPLFFENKKCIRIFGNGNECIIQSNSSMQPCIGVKTETNLSYGRWSESRYFAPESIYVENITLILRSAVTDFTIGKFGTNSMPKIILKNAKLICPEMSGKRELVFDGFKAACTTKYDLVPIYKINPDFYEYHDVPRLPGSDGIVKNTKLYSKEVSVLMEHYDILMPYKSLFKLLHHHNWWYLLVLAENGVKDLNVCETTLRAIADDGELLTFVLVEGKRDGFITFKDFSQFDLSGFLLEYDNAFNKYITI